MNGVECGWPFDVVNVAVELDEHVIDELDLYAVEDDDADDVD